MIKNENYHKTDPCFDIDRISCQLREHADPEADEGFHEIGDRASGRSAPCMRPQHGDRFLVRGYPCVGDVP